VPDRSPCRVHESAPAGDRFAHGHLTRAPQFRQASRVDRLWGLLNLALRWLHHHHRHHAGTDLCELPSRVCAALRGPSCRLPYPTDTSMSSPYPFTVHHGSMRRLIVCICATRGVFQRPDPVHSSNGYVVGVVARCKIDVVTRCTTTDLCSPLQPMA